MKEMKLIIYGHDKLTGFYYVLTPAGVHFFQTMIVARMFAKAQAYKLDLACRCLHDIEYMNERN